MNFNDNIINLIQQSIEEDIGSGDITSMAVINELQQADFFIIAREEMVICGVDIAGYIFEQLVYPEHFESVKKDGDLVKMGEIIIKGSGNALAILQAERVALNFLQHLSGIATETKKYVDEISDYPTKILDTRKTLPGYRFLQKYAVKIGGGYNHRMRLDDGILIKDNHIFLAGGVKSAINKAKKARNFLTRIEIECDNLEQVKEAIAESVDVIMLDNMSVEQAKEAIKIIDGRAIIEISGGVSLDNIKEYAAIGVDYISTSKITNSAKAVDIGLDMELANN